MGLLKLVLSSRIQLSERWQARTITYKASHCRAQPERSGWAGCGRSSSL